MALWKILSVFGRFERFFSDNFLTKNVRKVFKEHCKNTFNTFLSMSHSPTVSVIFHSKRTMRWILLHDNYPLLRNGNHSWGLHKLVLIYALYCWSLDDQNLSPGMVSLNMSCEISEAQGMRENLGLGSFFNAIFYFS